MSTLTDTPAAAVNRAVARDWIDAFNARDDAGEAAARAADYVAHAPASLNLPPLDSTAWLGFLDGFLEGFPDLRIEISGAVADDAAAAQRVVFTGTQTGPFNGLPPSGRSIRVEGLEINRMRDGLVVEHWFQMDLVSLFDQLGLKVVPGPRLLPRLIAAAVAGRVRAARSGRAR